MIKMNKTWITCMQRNGFTLIELMVTISVAAILLALAVPAFQNLLISNRITAQTNDLVSDLAFARSEAIKRGLRVSACLTSTPATTPLSCGAGTDWTVGWIVFVDTGTAGDATGDTILRTHEALSGNNTLAVLGNHFISYFPSGTVDAAETFTLCHTATLGRNVAVSSTGRVSTTPTTTICS